MQFRTASFFRTLGATVIISFRFLQLWQCSPKRKPRYVCTAISDEGPIERNCTQSIMQISTKFPNRRKCFFGLRLRSQNIPINIRKDRKVKLIERPAVLGFFGLRLSSFVCGNTSQETVDFVVDRHRISDRICCTCKSWHLFFGSTCSGKRFTL